MILVGESVVAAGGGRLTAGALEFSFFWTGVSGTSAVGDNGGAIFGGAAATITGACTGAAPSAGDGAIAGSACDIDGATTGAAFGSDIGAGTGSATIAGVLK